MIFRQFLFLGAICLATNAYASPEEKLLCYGASGSNNFPICSVKPVAISLGESANTAFAAVEMNGLKTTFSKIKESPNVFEIRMKAMRPEGANFARIEMIVDSKRPLLISVNGSQQANLKPIGNGNTGNLLLSLVGGADSRILGLSATTATIKGEGGVPEIFVTMGLFESLICLPMKMDKKAQDAWDKFVADLQAQKNCAG